MESLKRLLPIEWTIGLGLVVVVLFIIVIGIYRQSAASPSANFTAPATSIAAADSPPDPSQQQVSNWDISREINPVTGVETVVAAAGMRGYGLIVRQIGAKLDCYVDTGKFLETTENMEDGLSQVTYRFDGGNMIRESWSLSADNTALFAPGHCAAFVKGLRTAKTLAFQYSPADEVPQTISLDVAGFPADFPGKSASKN